MRFPGLAPRRRAFSLAAILILLLLILPACSSEPPLPEVVMFGDSMTYLGKWEELLREYNPRTDAVSGETTQFMLRRLDRTIAATPKVVAIMAGINDIRIGVDLDRIMQNYPTMVGRFKAASITPVVQSTLFVARDFENPKAINARVTELNKRLRSLCQAEGLVYLDLNGRFSRDGVMKPEYSRDGIHPNEAAYQVWADRLRPELVKLFNR